MYALAVDSDRINRVLKKQQGGDLSDKRGRHILRNKLPDKDFEYAKGYILSFPQYASYSTRNHSETKYLNSDLNAMSTVWTGAIQEIHIIVITSG